VPGADLFERELLERILAEDPRAREARRAHERWVTRLRVWSALDREGITEPGEQARFICERLWPDLRAEVVEAYAEAVRRSSAGGRPLVLPLRAADCVGEELERLMVEFGYPTAL
jgi:hypothetical protein